MKTTIVTLLLLNVLLISSGCGTIDYLNGHRNRYASNDGVKGSPIYGGVKLDANNIYYGPPGNGVVNMYPVCCLISIIDIPLSLVADTLLLPYTVTKTIRGRETDQKPNEVPATR
jgi:uncharacterized protein YceK